MERKAGTVADATPNKHFKISKECEYWFESGHIEKGDDIADFLFKIMNIDDLSKDAREKLVNEILIEYEAKKGVPKLVVVWKKNKL